MNARSPRRREALLAFDALHIEGGLLAPEWLTKAARLDAPHQAEADYRVPRGLNLRDEIGRAWRIAQTHHGDLRAGQFRNADPAALSVRFITALLRDVFGFASLTAVAPVVVGDRTYPIGHAALDGRVPVVIAPFGAGLDAPQAAFGEGGRRRSPFGLLQEALNARDATLWGIATDGDRLRIGRDNASLTRPAWIEADLARIFAEDRFADFAALWLLVHETRFGRPDARPEDCPLEAWREAGRQEGTRALGQLRVGVKDALEALGQGFLAHPDNAALRARLEDGSLTRRDLFQQLLRLAYRLIFLLTVEERHLLHPPRTPTAARALYEDGYGLHRLRERAARRSAHDHHADLWEALKVVLRGLDQGEPRLGLPALGGLFAARQCPDLDGARVQNRHLLQAVFRLAWMRDAGGLSRVNWRDMGPEELGSVYESLLELEPEVSVATRRFTFTDGAAGNARKTTGSYYTPDSLVQVLLDSAFEPVVADTLASNPTRPAEALLALAIVDPACGSGHFLLAAARRLAAHVARVSCDSTPSASDYRRALRQVVGRCIYGVDLNPMAVELCKVALWMEAVEPGLPLGFLDAHVRCGNALLGATPDLMEQGIPDDAWTPLEGDDKKVASALKKRNKAQRGGQQSMVSTWSKAGQEATALREAVRALEAAPDGDAKALAKKEAAWVDLQASEAWRRQHLVADAWCAAFMWPKPEGGGPVVEVAPTHAVWRDLADGRGTPSGLLVETVAGIAAAQRLFHWHLAFPAVFERGGFDVVLGNPPWERVKLQEQEFFATSRPDIVEAPNKGDRAALIASLATDDPALLRDWEQALRNSASVAQFLKNCGRYPLCGGGDVNTSSVFAELGYRLISPRGRMGVVVPTSLLTLDTTKAFPQEVVPRGVLVSVYDFENTEKLFPAVRPHQHFVLMTLSGQPVAGECDYAFFLKNPRQLDDPDTRVALSAQDIALLNPNTRTVPVFRTSAEAKVTKAIYKANPLLKDDARGTDGDPWGLRFLTMFHMATDSEAGFLHSDKRMSELVPNGDDDAYRRAGYLPLFDAKMAAQYQHRAASVGMSGHQFRKISKESSTPEDLQDPAYEVAAAYWVAEVEVRARLGDWAQAWLLGFKDVTGITSTRLSAFAFIPRTAVGHPFPLVFLDRVPSSFYAAFAGFMNSLLVEYLLRQKMDGLHLTYFLIKQLPAPTPADLGKPAPWDSSVSTAHWLSIRVAELSCTSWSLGSLASDLTVVGEAYRWDEERRLLLRADIDAAVFHLFRLSERDARFVIASLEKVARKDERVWGRPRTEEETLRAYRLMAEAASTGLSYASPLDPPPADARVAHKPSTRPTHAKEST